MHEGWTVATFTFTGRTVSPKSSKWCWQVARRPKIRKQSSPMRPRTDAPALRALSVHRSATNCIQWTKTRVVPSPETADRITNSDGLIVFADSIDPNDAVCVAFTEPAKLPHKSILLPGAKLAPSILTAEDKRIRRPRLNRGGGSIANMGVSNGQSYKLGPREHEHRYFERNLAQQTGQGADMYRTGNRAWGAMEPMPK
jgi:hypothetical protein